MVSASVGTQTDFCNASQCLEAFLLGKGGLTLELAIHNRRGGKVWSRLADRGSVHVEYIVENVDGNNR